MAKNSVIQGFGVFLACSWVVVTLNFFVGC